MDHPARVDHVVGAYRMPRLGETISVLGLGELVVRGARHHATAEPGIVSAERTPPVAHGANTSHSASYTSSAPTVSASSSCASSFARTSSTSVRTRRVPWSARSRARGLAHRAHALDGNRLPGEIVGAERVRDRGQQAVEYTDRRRGRGGPRAAGRLGLGEHEGGVLADDVHIGRRGVPRRHAVRYVPWSDSTRSPYRSRRSRRLAPVGISGTASTALPPPSGSPAIAFLLSSRRTGGARPVGRHVARRRSSCARRRRRDRARRVHADEHPPRSARRTERRPPRRPRPEQVLEHATRTTCGLSCLLRRALS